METDCSRQRDLTFNSLAMEGWYSRVAGVGKRHNQVGPSERDPKEDPKGIP